MMVDTGEQALIIDGVRTPRGKAKSDGALHVFHPQELPNAVQKHLIAAPFWEARDRRIN